MRPLSWFRREAMEWAVLILVFLSVLWRGGKGLEMTWFLGGVTVLVTFVSFWHERKREDRGDVPLLLWGITLLFVLWTVLSFALSRTRNYGFDEVVRDLSLVLIFFWLIRHVAQREQKDSFVSRLVTVLSVATLLACVAGVVIYLYQPVNRMVGTFVDYRFATDYWPNAWAEFLLLAWPAVWVWSRKMKPWLRLPIVGIVIGCLLLSFSRGAFIAFGGQLVVWAIIEAIRYMRGARQAPIVRMLRTIAIDGAVIAAIAIVVFLGVNRLRSIHYPVESVTAKATFTAEEGESSITERKAFWSAAWELSKARPLVGWGPYSFRFVQPALQTSVFETSDHPHNVFLKLAMERGWPAALLFLVILVLVLVPAFWRSCQRTDDRGQRTENRTQMPVDGRQVREKSKLADISLFSENCHLSSHNCLLSVAIVGVTAHNLIDFNLQFVGIVLPFWLFLGLLVQPVRLGKTLNARMVRIVDITLAIVLGCLLIIEGCELVISSQGRRAEARGDGAAALQWYDQAGGELYPRDMLLSVTHLRAERGDLDGASAALQRYMGQNSLDARAWELAGDIEELRGNPAQALANYGQGWQLGKYNYLGILTGSLQALSQMQDQTLIGDMQGDFESVYDAYGNAILQNTHFIALSENVEQFAKTTDLMARLYPASADHYRELARKVAEHSSLVRSQMASAHAGFLW